MSTAARAETSRTTRPRATSSAPSWALSSGCNVGCGKVGVSTAPTVTPVKPDIRIPIMATTTITDLPSRALDYKAMSAIRGAGPGDWVLSAFLPYTSPIAPILPIVNFYQTNYIADNLTVQTQNINVPTSAPTPPINLSTRQNSS